MWKEYNSLFPQRGWAVADANAIERLPSAYGSRGHNAWAVVVDFPDIKMLWWADRKAYFIAVKVEA